MKRFYPQTNKGSSFKDIGLNAMHGGQKVRKVKVGPKS